MLSDLTEEKEIIFPVKKDLLPVIPLVIDVVDMMRFELHTKKTIVYFFILGATSNIFYSECDFESRPELNSDPESRVKAAGFGASPLPAALIIVKCCIATTDKVRNCKQLSSTLGKKRETVLIL